LTDDVSTQAAFKVQELQRKLYRAAKAQPRRTFGILYDKVCSEMVVRTAFEQVRRNRGAAGVDGITVESIEASGVERFLAELREELRQETYRPMPVRRVYIPKGDGKQRPLGIPRVRSCGASGSEAGDQPLFEASFRRTFGFRQVGAIRPSVDD
jgi:retron-type reverse transcriptase